MPNYYMPSPAEYQMSPTSFAYLSPQEKYNLMYTPQEQAGWGAPVSWNTYDQQRAAAGFLPRSQLGVNVQPTSQFYPSVRTNYGLDAPPPGGAVTDPGTGNRVTLTGSKAFSPAGWSAPPPPAYTPGREDVPASLRAYTPKSPAGGAYSQISTPFGASGGTGDRSAGTFGGTVNTQTPGKASSGTGNWYSPLQGSTQQRSDRYWK